MTPDELKKRTRRFAVDVLRHIDGLPRGNAGWIIARQLGRAATAVGANYRTACRARSKADFLSKLTVVEEEADECMYWLEVLGELGMPHEEVRLELLHEADELTAIFTAAGRTTRSALSANPKSTFRNPK